MNELYLAHHGIKGQKWGIRRFQNADGTRTAEGKKRYSGMSDETKQKLKTAGKIAVAAATVAAAAYVYAKNKPAIDNAVKGAIKSIDNKAMALNNKLDSIENRYNETGFKKLCDKGNKYVDSAFSSPFMKGVKRVGAASLEGAGIIAGTKLMNKMLGEESNDLIDVNNAYKKKDDRIKSQKVNEVVQKAAKKEIKNAAKNSFKIKRREED